MTHLRSLRIGNNTTTGLPFNVPVVRSLTELSLHAAETFFVGENGSGKSTDASAPHQCL